MNAEQLWEKYSYIQKEEDGYSIGVMIKTDFLTALSSYNPWVTDRQPTVEDGDSNGYVEIWNTIYELTSTVKYDVVNIHTPWRKIIKPLTTKPKV
jgi:hypothetical protein